MKQTLQRSNHTSHTVSNKVTYFIYVKFDYKSREAGCRHLVLAWRVPSLCRNYKFFLFQLLKKQHKMLTKNSKHHTRSSDEHTFGFIVFSNILTFFQERNHFIYNVLKLSVWPGKHKVINSQSAAYQTETGRVIS